MQGCNENNYQFIEHPLSDALELITYLANTALDA